MATAEHREPYESRGSRTVLGAPGGEIPPGDSTKDIAPDAAVATAAPYQRLDRLGPTITLQVLKTFARQARNRMRTESGYRRDYFRALAQCVEMGTKELLIMGSKTELLRTLVAASSAKTAGFGADRYSELARPREFEPCLPNSI
jgi:hypothetical protein